MLKVAILTFLLLATENVRAGTKTPDSKAEIGCFIDPSSNLRGCEDEFGNKVSTYGLHVLPVNTSCILEDNNQTFNISCLDGMNVISLPRDQSIVRKKRGLLGFLGVAGLICTVLCGHSHRPPPPPPNKPPQIKTHSTLKVPTPIIAEKGKIKAKVQWTEPTIYDPEDGKLNVETYPNFQNGGEFSEGTTVVYFKGTDSGMLSVTDYLSFEVKVERCRFPKWPENGNIDCHGATDIIFGTTCTVTCNHGYILDEGAKQTFTCLRHGVWDSQNIPDCRPRACEKEPSVSHGIIQCLHNRKIFDNVCEVVCEEGFRAHGMNLMSCDSDGEWGSPPSCKDVLPPRFYDGECPSDMQVYIDSTDNTAEVTWTPPTGEDNSKETVTITETHGFKPGQRFKAGSHTIHYTIEDQARNRGDSCVFSVEVLTISCSPPNLHVSGGDHLKYECSESYRLGAVCNLGCKSGYPMGGANKIQCVRDTDAHPPVLSWTWDKDALAPFCKETNCSRAALNEPINGALACSEWTHGQMCNIQCNDGFDIPNIGDGMFVCGRSTGKWKPPGKVPDCNTKIDVNNMHLPNEFYYYTGACNSSINNLNQIKENFVHALNTSKFQEDCVGVPECQARYVGVTCGPVSSRRKRDVLHQLYRRSAEKFAYVIQFQLIIPYKVETGKSPDDVFAENEDLLSKMSDTIQKEADSGHFDLHIGDLKVYSDSYGPGAPSMQCPPGTIPRRKSASCVGCPKGQYATKAGRCMLCPIGTYQNSTNSLKCERCPPNTNTTETGAENVSQCLGYCSAGEYSPNYLAPCTKCGSNAYQPNAKSSACIRCDANKKTSKNGATAQSQCQIYDLQMYRDSGKVKIDGSHDVITVFMWLFIGSVKTETGFKIMKQKTNQEFLLKITPLVTVTNSRNELNIGQTIIPSSVWTSVAFSIDKTSNEFILYIEGKNAYRNSSFVFPNLHVLELNDLIGLVGDMKISAFYLLPRKASDSEIKTWTSTCTPAITGAVVSMDDFADVGNVSVMIPSVCDAVNECSSSPCGTHKCLNRLGGYECLCTGGYTGKQCQFPPDFCKDNNCMNRATCVNGTVSYTCQCPYGFSGALCEIKAVNGQWSEWSLWTTCSKSCGGGVATRVRRCDSPPPDLEGNTCPGQNIESKPCKEEKCPECSRLQRSLGLIINCNETSELKVCVLSCRANFYFTSPPLPYYECGLATGYKWNHQNNDNPAGRLPSCSQLQPPVEIGVDFEGRYDSVPCTEAGKHAVKDALEAKMSTLDCKKAGTCETKIQEPICTPSKNKSAPGSSMIVGVGLHAGFNDKVSLNVAELLQNESSPSNELLELEKQTLELEKSAQKLMNNSVDFFQVTIDGTKHSLAPGMNSLTFRPATRCPSGTVRIKVFCAECPVGSYSDGKTVTMCPRGQYQDMKGQSTCKKCPSGKTTVGIGSIHLSECSVSVSDGNQSATKTSQGTVSNDAVQIGIGVSVSISLLILSAVGAVFLYKHYCKNCRKRTLNNSMLHLHTSGFSDMRKKTAFGKWHP